MLVERENAITKFDLAVDNLTDGSSIASVIMKQGLAKRHSGRSKMGS